MSHKFHKYKGRQVYHEGHEDLIIYYFSYLFANMDKG